MEAFRATAIRVCGAATVVVVCISVEEIAGVILGLTGLPRLQMALGVAVLVSLASFAVANAPRISIAESICVSSVAVIAVLSAVYIYKVAATPTGPGYPAGPSLNIADGALVLASYALLFHLCRSVLGERRMREPDATEG
jgi:hypothetical protein